MKKTITETSLSENNLIASRDSDNALIFETVNRVLGDIEKYLSVEDTCKLAELDLLIGELESYVLKTRANGGPITDFGDYNSRLSVQKEDFDRVFNEKVLIGELKNIWDRMIALFPDSETLKASIDKIFKAKAEDLVYESLHIGDYPGKAREENHFFTKSLEWHKDSIKIKSARGVKILHFTSFSNQADHDLLMEIFKVAVASGIKGLNFNGSNIGDGLTRDEFFDLIRFAGQSGIKCLGLGVGGLGSILRYEDLMEFFRMIGGSSIRGITMHLNDFSFLTPEEYWKVIEEADRSGLYFLCLDMCGLGEYSALTAMFKEKFKIILEVS